MHTSSYWLEHFGHNATIKRIDWTLQPRLTPSERKTILKPLQAWQLGETSDGCHLLCATKKYASRVKDPCYYPAVQLFIKEEQKHGHNLGKYLDLIHEPRIKANWADSLFRKIRYFNTSMELWTLSVITVETAAQIFYQSLKDATQCRLLKQICTDILIDEAFHIDFQLQRFSIIYKEKGRLSRWLHFCFYKLFYFSTLLLVWLAYRQVFKAGKNGFRKYYWKIKVKFRKTILRLV